MGQGSHLGRISVGEHCAFRRAQNMALVRCRIDLQFVTGQTFQGHWSIRIRDCSARAAYLKGLAIHSPVHAHRVAREALGVPYTRQGRHTKV
jgi:hypothetical protein